jgi:hypothetical protein
LRQRGTTSPSGDVQTSPLGRTPRRVSATLAIPASLPEASLPAAARLRASLLGRLLELATLDDPRPSRMRTRGGERASSQFLTHPAPRAEDEHSWRGSKISGHVTATEREQSRWAEFDDDPTDALLLRVDCARPDAIFAAAQSRSFAAARDFAPVRGFKQGVGQAAEPPMLPANLHRTTAALALPGSEADPGAALDFRADRFPPSAPDFPQPPLGLPPVPPSRAAVTLAAGRGAQSVGQASPQSLTAVAAHNLPGSAGRAAFSPTTEPPPTFLAARPADPPASADAPRHGDGPRTSADFTGHARSGGGAAGPLTASGPPSPRQNFNPNLLTPPSPPARGQFTHYRRKR